MLQKKASKAKSCPGTPQRGTPVAVVTPSKQKDQSRKSEDYESPVPSNKKVKRDGSQDDDIDGEKSIVSGLGLATPSSTEKQRQLPVDWRVEKVYHILRCTTGQLGGNGYNGAIYGELTMRSMQRVVNLLVEKCGLDSSSRFIDVGSGLGKPNFHVAQDPAVRLSIGVELEEIRWQLSMHNMDRFLPHLLHSSGPFPAALTASSSIAICSQEDGDNTESLLGGVNFYVGDIDCAKSMDPFTHVYMFDLGFPPPLQKSIARKFNNSVHATCLVSYRPPRRVIDEYGYAVEFVDQMLTSMHGSGEGHTAYIYRRTNKAPKTPKLPNQHVLQLPARAYVPGEQACEVYCDAAFLDACKLAADPDPACPQLCAHVKKVVHDHMNGTRAKRERKPRVLDEIYVC